MLPEIVKIICNDQLAVGLYPLPELKCKPAHVYSEANI